MIKKSPPTQKSFIFNYFYQDLENLLKLFGLIIDTTQM